MSELTNIEAAMIKGMLARGDKQSDIAACFLVNGGRVAEINTGLKFQDVDAARPEDLPPPGPYPSPYELWKAKQGLWALRVTMKAAREKMDVLLAAIEKTEKRLG